jgi:hypothetical protein
MKRLPTFLRREDGAVTVDYVVLVSGGVVAALIVATVWQGAFTNFTLRMEEEAARQGVVASGGEMREVLDADGNPTGELDWVPTGSWAAAMRDYPPYNPILYERLVQDFSSLSDADLDEMERYVNAYYRTMKELAGDNPTNYGMLDDLDFAIGLSYLKRYRGRPNDLSEPDPQQIGRIASDLGWGDGLVAQSFDGAQQVSTDPVEMPSDLFGG